MYTDVKLRMLKNVSGSIIWKRTVIDCPRRTKTMAWSQIQVQRVFVYFRRVMLAYLDIIGGASGGTFTSAFSRRVVRSSIRMSLRRIMCSSFRIFPDRDRK